MRLKYFFILLIVAFFLTSDLLINRGRPTTFDGHVHITTMAQYFLALKDGEFPVQWANGFANYGYPLAIVAHQVPAYAGAVVNFFTNNIVLSFKIVFFIAIILSTTALYIFLKEYADKRYALIAAIFFNFAPYRIINIYIRGALPEVVASIFLPVALLGLHRLFVKKKFSGLVIFIVGLALLAYSHPMMLFIHGLLIFAYAIFLIFQYPAKLRLNKIFIFLAACFISGLLAASYLLPLKMESKYFIAGSENHEITEAHYFKMQNFFSPNWYYFKGHPGPRGNLLKVGLPEISLFIFIVIYTLLNWKKSSKTFKFWVGAGVVSLVLTTAVGRVLYDNSYLFSNIQYPWRFLANFIFILPICLSTFLQKKKINAHILAALLIIFLLLRLPQIYGKNYVVYDQSHYFFTRVNLHSQNLNTVWMGNSLDYPVKEIQTKIIEGNGQLSNLEVKNSRRTMKIEANEEVRVADYSFYFPGWKVLIDGQKTEVQYQDPNHRGYLTFLVPPGEHNVIVKYSWSPVRLLSVLLSGFGLCLFLGMIVFRKKMCSSFQISL